MMAANSDSDSSIPVGYLPGSGPLTFLPVQAPNTGNDNDIKSDSGSDSSDQDIGLPGGDTNTLTFLPVSYNPSHDSQHNDSSNSNSSSSSDEDIGLPGGGNMNDITFLPTNTYTYTNTNTNTGDTSSSSSSSSSDDIGLPGGGNQLRFVPTNNININNNNNNNQMNILSSSEEEEEEEEEELKRDRDRDRDTDIWDLVYMTSSPLAYTGKEKIIPLELLDVSRETEQIMSVLSSADRELCVCHLIATSGNLIKAMTHSCRILHYSGHGFPSYLAFEDENSIGDTHMLRDTVLLSAVKQKKHSKRQLQFVFTSACHSESVGLSFVSAGVPHVVSIDTKFEVSDEGAMTFTKYFYEALLCGRTIRDSFNFAKQSVEFVSSSAKRDFAKFKLLPINGKHNISLFGKSASASYKLRKGNIINKTPLIPPNNLPTTICPFIGRSIDMREIIHSFMSKKNEACRILNIYGDRGVGKSAITIMICRYLNDRKIYFTNGIYYIDSMKLIKNEEAITLAEMINNILMKVRIANFNFKVMNKLDIFELINNLKLFCRYGLFIIDDIDQLISYYKMNDIDVNKELFGVIFKILLLVSEKIKFIIISKKICDDNIYKYNNNSTISPKTYHLKRLSSTDTSNLFAKLTAMTWRPNDIKENIDIMSILKNNPLQIHQLAKLKNQWECKTLTKLVETYNFKNKLERKHNIISQYSNNNNNINIELERKQNREYLIQQHINNISAQQVWRKAHGMLICHYHKIFEILKSDFIEFTFSKRKLQQNNLIECFRILGMNNDLTINIEKFDIIYQWFNGISRLVQTLNAPPNNYYNKISPIIIHGFVSRDDANKMLLNIDNNSNIHIPIGTFIIRFRYRQSKSIAISYKQTNNKVSNLKCDLSNNNDSTFICGKKLLPLPQFILTFKPLKYLYNTNSPIAKENIFSNSNINNNPHNHSTSNHHQQQQQPSFTSFTSFTPFTQQQKQKTHLLPSSYHAKSYGPPLSKTQKSYY